MKTKVANIFLDDGKMDAGRRFVRIVWTILDNIRHEGGRAGGGSAILRTHVGALVSKHVSEYRWIQKEC